MVGFCGGMDDCKDCVFGGLYIWRFLMLFLRNMIYLKILSRGVIGRFVGLFFVLNDLIEKKKK